MRILQLKLLSRFRGLPANTEFKFDEARVSENRIEPICLVGLNGTGKSNLLEVICEIFYFLENYVLCEGKPRKSFETPFGFELSFIRSFTFGEDRSIDWEGLNEIVWSGTEEIMVRYSKAVSKLPRVTITNRGGKFHESSEADQFILPQHVIAYSSGQNELISNPFIKSSYNYFKNLESKQSIDQNLELGLTRLIFLDYESSRLMSVCNFLFSDDNNVELIKKALLLDDLDSFSITIQFRNYRNNKISFARTIGVAIENLKACATAIVVSERTIKMAFKVDEELKRAFRRRFGSAILLFRDLFYLNLLNIHWHPVDIRRKIKDSPSGTYDNLSRLIPVPMQDKLVFLLDRVRFLKKGKSETIKYKELSDGEHQMMHVLGSIMLLNTPGSILVYDEPETHFNPDWRSKLIGLINVSAREKGKAELVRRQNIFITSHSPFIVSDCKPENVFIFSKVGSKVNVTTALQKEVKTFGSSVNLITYQVFGKQETISGLGMQTLNDYRKRFMKGANIDDILFEIDLDLGDSVEKTMFINELLELDQNKTSKKKRRLSQSRKRDR